MPTLFQSRYFHAGVSALIALVVLIIYSNTFNASFHFDDNTGIVNNYSLRDLGNLPSLLMERRGLTNATFALNYAAGGLDTTGYHVVNTFVHIASAILAYFIVFYTMVGSGGDVLRSKRVAAFAALLFAVHPIQTQAVTYIIQRMESLSAMFFLAGLFFFIKGARARTTGCSLAFYACVPLSYLLAFKSKEITITFPVLILLYDHYFVSRFDLKAICSRLHVHGALLLLLAYFMVTTVVPMGDFGDLSEEAQLTSGSGVVLTEEAEGAPDPAGVEHKRGDRAPSAGFGVKSISPKEYLYTQFNVLVYYMTLLAFPANQNLDYDFPVSRGLFEVPKVHKGTVLNYPQPPPVVTLLILLAIIGTAIFLYLRARRSFSAETPEGSPGGRAAALVSFFIFWFFIVLLPTSSFVPIIDVIFEHRVYLASLGGFVIFAVCFDMCFSRFGRSPGAGDESGAETSTEGRSAAP